MIGNMSQSQYRRWRQHPVTRLLFSATGRGTVVYDDQIADLRLPDGRLSNAFREAVELAREVQGKRGDERNDAITRVERAAYAITSALPETYEDAATQRRRRALEGDPEAVRALEAEGRAIEAAADAAMRDEIGGSAA